MGFDADNQAATVAGLMGVIDGMKGLPEDLYLPVKGWTKPFNDKYINITRHDLPDTEFPVSSIRTVETLLLTLYFLKVVPLMVLKERNYYN
jgi:hypothetical protein